MLSINFGLTIKNQLPEKYWEYDIEPGSHLLIAIVS